MVSVLIVAFKIYTVELYIENPYTSLPQVFDSLRNEAKLLILCLGDA